MPYAVTAWLAQRLVNFLPRMGCSLPLIRVTSQITQLQFMHMADVTHRDIHPGNVGLTTARGDLSEAIADDGWFGGLFEPAFIDYEFACIDGANPNMADVPAGRMWWYMSDSAVLHGGVYA